MKLLIKTILYIFLFSHFLLLANFSFEFEDKIISSPTIYFNDNEDINVVYNFKYKDNDKFGFSSISTNKENIFFEKVFDSNDKINNYLSFEDKYIFKTKNNTKSKKIFLFINFYYNDFELQDIKNNKIYSASNVDLHSFFNYFDISKGKIIKYKNNLIIPLNFKDAIAEVSFNLDDKKLNLMIKKNINNIGSNISILNNNDENLIYIYKKDNNINYYFDYTENSNEYNSSFTNPEKIDSNSVIKSLLINNYDDEKIFIVLFNNNNKLKAISGTIEKTHLNKKNSFEIPIHSNDFDIEKDKNNDIIISYINNNKLYLQTIPLSFFSKGLNKKIEGIEKDSMLNLYKYSLISNLKNRTIPKNLDNDFNISFDIGFDTNKNRYSNIFVKSLLKKYNTGNLGTELNIYKDKNSFNISSYLVNKNILNNDITIQEKIGYNYSLIENNVITDYLNFSNKIQNHNFLTQFEFEKKLNFNKQLYISPYLSYYLSIGKHKNSKTKNIYNQEINIKNNINLSNNLIIGANLEYKLNDKFTLELFPNITLNHNYINSNLEEEKIIENDLNAKLNINLKGILNKNNKNIKFGIGYTNDIKSKNNNFNINFDYSFN